MKRILNGAVKVTLVLAVIAGHFLFWRWAVGETFSLVYTAIQILVALWMAYELIRAPVIDD